VEMKVFGGQLPASSPLQMAKLITEFCIEFFDRTTCDVGTTTNESIHQIFENSINSKVGSIQAQC